MIRDLNYSIQFAEGNEYVLTHEMRLIEGDAKGLYESFAIEGTGVHGARFTRAQLALLHRAIHEMKRMRQQHRAALTDGAEQQPAKPDPAPDEAEVALTAEAMSLLRGMGKGYRVHDNVEGGRCRFANAVATMPEARLEELQNRRLVQILEQDELNSRCVWGISVEGSAYLAAQEPDDSAWSDRPRTGDDD